MKPITYIILALFLISCGTQKRMQYAKKAAATAIETATVELKKINEFNNKTSKKLSTGEIDSTISTAYDQVLNKFQNQLDTISNLSNALLNSNHVKFRSKTYKVETKAKIAAIDSFNLSGEARKRVYSLINDAIDIDAFNLFDLAAFFGPGVYKIPSEALPNITQSFLPAITSMSALSNKYSDVPHYIHIALIGFADATPIAEGSELYNELSSYVNENSPPRQLLNWSLSDLRAKELLNKMKLVVSNKAALFKHYDDEIFKYNGWGKGEAYPMPTIKDYKEADERRRIVLCYWAVLPVIK